MEDKSFGHSKVDAVSAELRAKGLPEIEPVDESIVDEMVDRMCESDSHLERFAGGKLAQLVASEIIEQHLRWSRTLRDVDPLTPTHFNPYFSGGVTDIDVQLYTFYSEFANPKLHDSVGFWVCTDNRKTKRHKPAQPPLEQRTPIERLEQYRLVVERRIDPVVKGCQLNISF
jgi:hypothetical protein